MDGISGIFQAAAKLTIGKKVGGAIYIHSSVQATHLPLPEEIMEVVRARMAKWNCLKIASKEETLSFLLYKDFEETAHPVLMQALTYHVCSLRIRLITYREDHNPPILHRKELLVGFDHPLYEQWALQTAVEERLGLYEDSRTIGFLDNWTELLRSKGIIETEEAIGGETSIDRHKTAITRSSLSKPVQALLTAGMLTREKSLFDYGCGKGDDVASLRSAGFLASGWDPVHRPNEPKQEADVVNLGFVLNVIENPSERVKVLHDAFNLARSVLCVSTLIENMQTSPNLKPYKDGYLTSRNTFQKYYNQAELAQLLEDALGKPIAASSPGVFFVFQKSEEAEQYFVSKSSRQSAWTDWGIKKNWSTDERTTFKKDKFFADHELEIDHYWQKTLELGRFPEEDEFEGLGPLIEKTGAIRRLRSWIIEHFGSEVFERALARKREDIIVFLALRHFQKRLTLKNLPIQIQRDIQASFPNYSTAWETAKAFLFQIGKPDVIAEKCNKSEIGLLDKQALYVTPSEVEELDPVLRIYVQTGELFYGDRSNADEIKIHKASSKVTFLSYEKPISERKTRYRTKVNLASQKVEFYDHSMRGGMPVDKH